MKCRNLRTNARINMELEQTCRSLSRESDDGLNKATDDRGEHEGMRQPQPEGLADTAI